MTMCECGATQRACDEAWGECLSLEFVDPGYGAVHHLTVASFMLQHPSRLSATGWREERRLLGEFIEDGVEPAAVRKRPTVERPSLKRGDRIILDGIDWSRTIVDVRRSQAASYRSDVRTWAGAVLADLDRHGPVGQ